MEDTDDTPDTLEYFFKATLTEPDDSEYTIQSGMEEGSLLMVTACPEENPDCAMTCSLGDNPLGGSEGDEFNATQACQPSIDCTTSPWSECNPDTNKKTRDVSKCIISGEDEVCMANAKATIPAEQPCMPKERPKMPKERPKTQSVSSDCGDGICDRDEDEEDCPEDCAGGAGWMIFLIIILLAAGASVAGYFIKKRMAMKEEEKPKEDAMPFNNEKDLNSVLEYIKSAKARNLDESNIAAALVKGGWKEDQVNYAFKKYAKPGEKPVQIKKKPEVKPAEQKPMFVNDQDRDAVVKYVKEAYKRGMVPQQIADALLKSGRTKDQVKMAFRLASQK